MTRFEVPDAMMKPRENWSRFWRLPVAGNAELLHARFVDYAYDRHVHDRYVFGATTRGVEGFWYRGAVRVATVGQVVVVNPDDVHDGRSIDEDQGWTRRISYIEPTLFAEVAHELGRPAGLPLFGEAVRDDRDLAERFVGFHADAEMGMSALESDQRLRELVAVLITRHACGTSPERDKKMSLGEPVAVRQVRDFLDAHLEETVSLADLGALVGLAPLYLARIFRRSVGLPPHAYQTQRRLRRAAELLRSGEAPIVVAMVCGFADQAHLTRVFRRTFGVPPGRFRSGSFKTRREERGMNEAM